MENPVHLPHLRELIIFLVIAALLVPTFQRLRVSPSLGFLIIGTCIGPFGLGMFVDQISFFKYAVIDDIEGVKAFAELGIMFLLFTIGLGLSGERLWAMRRLIFGLGFSQVMFCALAITFGLWLLGLSLQLAVLIGASLALSSTAMVIHLLIEKGEFSSPLGRTSFSILLFQDLAVVPILLLVAFLGAETENGLAVSLFNASASAVIVLTVIVLVGRSILRPLFSLVTYRNSPEFFMAMTLLVIIGFSVATASAGLSLALGAFLAGLLLAETEFRHQIEIDIAPFKGLLLGLFFMSIGMGINLQMIYQNLNLILASVAALLVIKAAVTALFAILFQVPKHIAIATGLIVAQAGEFTFVIISMATGLNLIPISQAQIVIAVASLSMMLTPFLVSIAFYVKEHFSPENYDTSFSAESKQQADLENHIVIVGFGRAGEIVANMLAKQQTPYIGVDRNGSRVIEMKNNGHPVLFANATRKEVFEALGADRASAIVITLNDYHYTTLVVKICKKFWPHLPIFASCHNETSCQKLLELGVTCAIPEKSESSMRLAGYVLNEIGVPVDAVNTSTEQMRHDYLTKPSEQSSENEKHSENNVLLDASDQDELKNALRDADKVTLTDFAPEGQKGKTQSAA